MKKFYTKVMMAVLSACLLITASSGLKAQEICPPGVQKVFRAIGYDATGQPVSMVYIENFLPNAPISLFQNGQIFYNGFATDASGNGRTIYNPATVNPDFVSTCSIPGCCQTPVPPAITCTGTVLNVKYPANPGNGTPELCCIYLSNSIPAGEVRVFDANQNLIPTASSTYAFTNLAGFVCYVYPCNALPTSITVCGATGCCSQQVTQQASLPIKLTGFTAKLSNDNKVLLNWISSLEIGSDKYIIEKSADGRSFTAISEIKSGGNTTSNRSYAFIDANFNATAYYRLRMVDIDGQATYSKVVYVNLKGGSGLVTQIFPNPFKSDIQLIGISSTDLNSKNVRIYSSTGQQVAFKIVGANAIAIDEHAPSGLYILSVKEQRFKLIKE